MIGVFCYSGIDWYCFWFVFCFETWLYLFHFVMLYYCVCFVYSVICFVFENFHKCQKYMQRWPAWLCLRLRLGLVFFLVAICRGCFNIYLTLIFYFNCTQTILNYMHLNFTDHQNIYLFDHILIYWSQIKINILNQPAIRAECRFFYWQ